MIKYLRARFARCGMESGAGTCDRHVHSGWVHRTGSTLWADA